MALIATLFSSKKILQKDPLTEFFHYCLTSVIYPSGLKIIKTVPIFREGKIDDPSDYRPISVLLNGTLFDAQFEHHQGINIGCHPTYIQRQKLKRSRQFDLKNLRRRKLETGQTYNS